MGALLNTKPYANARVVGHQAGFGAMQVPMTVPMRQMCQLRSNSGAQVLQQLRVLIALRELAALLGPSHAMASFQNAN